MKYQVPPIDAEELKTFVRAKLPHASVALSTINPQYESWRLTIKTDGIWYEYSWGPLSGFGFTDVNAEAGENDNSFAPYEISLSSMAEAKQCLLNKIYDAI